MFFFLVTEYPQFFKTLEALFPHYPPNAAPLSGISRRNSLI